MANGTERKLCAICGETVDIKVIQCPKCGKGVFETKKSSSWPSRPPAGPSQIPTKQKPMGFLRRLFGLAASSSRDIASPQEDPKTYGTGPQSGILAWAFIFGFDHMPSRQEVERVVASDPGLCNVTVTTGVLSGPPPEPGHGLEALAFTMARSHGRSKLHHEIDLAKVTFQILQGFLVIRIRQ